MRRWLIVPGLAAASALVAAVRSLFTPFVCPHCAARFDELERLDHHQQQCGVMTNKRGARIE